MVASSRGLVSFVFVELLVLGKMNRLVVADMMMAHLKDHLHLGMDLVMVDFVRLDMDPGMEEFDLLHLDMVPGMMDSFLQMMGLMVDKCWGLLGQLNRMKVFVNQLNRLKVFVDVQGLDMDHWLLLELQNHWLRHLVLLVVLFVSYRTNWHC